MFIINAIFMHTQTYMTAYKLIERNDKGLSQG